MAFIADLHVHSRYSRATSQDLTLEGLYQWARVKGITVVGTGDFTHPRWFQELKEKLLPLGNGLYRLKEPPREPPLPGVRLGGEEVYFCLSTEISTIYKQGGKVRKNHNLVFAPDLSVVERFNARLSQVGNLASDGRPILGISCRNLLELVRSTSSEMVLIPAHVWTPWFSLFGSRSGYDRIEECFGDMSGEIFALETGLSSDPPMNWRVSALDRFTLISNSDAHSPRNLGREANRFDCPLSYKGIFEAIRTRKGFLGTLEFFPEEGKYHLDGHRRCGVVLEPEETLKLKGRCPACGEPVTVGVLHRVWELADRPPHALPHLPQSFQYLIPLPEIIAHVYSTTASSRKFLKIYSELLSAFGSEFAVLFEAPLPEITRASDSLLAEAIRRMRAGEVQVRGGYDGEYGRIEIFREEERKELKGQRAMIPFSSPGRHLPREKVPPLSPLHLKEPLPSLFPLPANLTEEQRAILEDPSPWKLVQAGPGTGKTHTLVTWVATLLQRGVVRGEEALLLTFTRKAAGELRERLRRWCEQEGLGIPMVDTFHGFAYALLCELEPECSELLPPELEASLWDLLLDGAYPGRGESIRRGNREGFLNPEHAEEARLHQRFREVLRSFRFRALSELLPELLERMERNDPPLMERLARIKLLAVDELQDLSPVQLALVKALLPGRIFLGIGDPDQEIYGFRGSDPAFFEEMARLPGMKRFTLTLSQRVPEPILKGAVRILPHPREARSRILHLPAPVVHWDCSTPEEEAKVVAGEVVRFPGGVHTLSLGSSPGACTYAPEEIAILFRLKRLVPPVLEALKREGVPVQWQEEQSLFASPPFSYLRDLLHLCAHPDNPLFLARVLADLEPDLPWKTFPLSLPQGVGSERGERFLRLWEEQRRSLVEGREREGVAVFLERLRKMFLPLFPPPENPLLFEIQWERVIAEAQGCGNDLKRFLTLLNLDPFFAQDGSGRGVRLLTFHAAKGLEFPVVILVGVEEGIVPLKGSDVSEEEERRLFFVALTRTSSYLILTSARHRRSREGDRSPSSPSSFLKLFPPGLMEVRRPPQRVQLTLNLA